MLTGSTRRLVEAAGVAALGAAFGGAVGAAVGLAVPAAVVGGLNGAISGWRGIYDWRCSDGLVAFTLDSTWGLPMTAAGLVAQAVSMVQPSGYVPGLSERHNRHVYRRGFGVRKGFAVTLGNVICQAGEVERPRRARLVTDHEDVHVWQSRWFGPAYPALYVGWMVLGGAAGAVRWVVDRRAKGDRLFSTIESAAYYLNPFEWWAYSRDDYWPPNGKVVDFGWRRPCCAPLTVARPGRLSGIAQMRVTPARR
jgi:hypothetical protein